jgi:hypothetical protein
LSKMGMGIGRGEVRLSSPITAHQMRVAGRREENEAFAVGEDDDGEGDGVELEDRRRQR